MDTSKHGRVISEWEVPILHDDMTTVENTRVIVYGTEDGEITGVAIKTRNGLKHYGDRVRNEY